MKITNLINELGLLKINQCLCKYDKKLKNNLLEYFPISNEQDYVNLVDKSIFKLLNYNKKNIFILSNELLFLERLSYYNISFQNIIVCLSHSLNDEQKDNIKHNIPNNLNISFINELEFPTLLKPNNSLIVTFGYRYGTNYILSENNYSLIETYKSFLGKKILITCSNDSIAYKPMNWVSINRNNDLFTEVI